MTDQTAPPPSQVLDAAQLDNALLVVVVDPDGTAFSSILAGVDRVELAAWLREFADVVGCAGCINNTDHDHP